VISSRSTAGGVGNAAERWSDGWHSIAWAAGRELFTTLPVIIAIIAVGTYAAFSSEFFLSRYNLSNILLQASALGVLAVGMTFLMIAGYFDVSVGAQTSFMAVVATKLAADGQGDVTVILVVLAAGAAVGAFTGGLVALTGVSPFIVTLGGLSVFVGLGLILTGGSPLPLPFESLSGLGIGSTVLGLPTPGVVFLTVLTLGAVTLRYAAFARGAYAVGSSREAAYLCGVPVGAVTVAVFVVNGLMVGTAGILFAARIGSADATGGVGLELEAIAAVVLGGAALTGGRGNMWGTLLGVLLFGEIANALTIAGTPAFYQDLIFGGVLIVSVVIAAVRENRRGRGRARRWLRAMRAAGRRADRTRRARQDESGAATMSSTNPRKREAAEP
jgi:ribose/xylose/arabinose/galactoside ABC-type transport system permease subunit